MDKIKTPVRYTIYDPDRFKFAVYKDANGVLSPEQIATALNTAADQSRVIEELTAELAALRREVEAGKKIDGSTSDGYHTFDELYEYRKLYNAALFNEWWALRETLYGFQFNVHKSKRHSDGELCFGGGWFIVQATLPTGQISNHYKLDDWDLFKCEEREQADTYDGHSPSDVAIRLAQFLALEGESR